MHEHTTNPWKQTSHAVKNRKKATQPLPLLDAHHVLAEADPDRYDTARRQIEDHTLRVTEIISGPGYLSGRVETCKKLKWIGYHVLLDGWEHSCECKDWEYRGPGTQYPSNGQITTCKHQIALCAWSIAQEIKQAA